MYFFFEFWRKKKEKKKKKFLEPASLRNFKEKFLNLMNLREKKKNVLSIFPNSKENKFWKKKNDFLIFLLLLEQIQF